MWHHLLPLAHSATEMASAMYLDRHGAILGARHFLSHSAVSVDVPIRAIVADALALDATQVVIAHNHPSGDVEPSDDDLRFTRRLFATLEAVGVRLADHIVVSATACLSFRERRYL